MKKISPNIRTSVCALSKRGSITAEAAMVVSFFFLAVICLTYLFQILSLQVTVRNGLHAVGRKMAVELCENPVMKPDNIKKELIRQIGEDRLDTSLIVGGSAGIDCSRSKQKWNTTIVDLSAVYRIEIPILLFRIPMIRREETLRIKGWTGYEGGNDWAESEEMVYVTEHGMVYHTDRNCTYLDLSIRTVEEEQIHQFRNLSGGKYQRCTSCRKDVDSPWVYITDYGELYHGSLDCRKLRRRVYPVSLREVYGLGGCSKCVR